jgi:uncharacterized protein (DUF302 family)
MNFKTLVTLILVFGLSANASQDIRIFTADDNGGKVTAKTIQKAFKEAGFRTIANNNMNKAFDAKFKTHTHDAYNLMILYKESRVQNLLKKYPKIALFTPLSMSIYKRKGAKTISVSSMDVAGIAKVTGIPVDNVELIGYMQEIADVFAKALPNGKFEKVNYTIAKPEGTLVNTFSMKMDVKEEEIEAGLTTSGFVMAGFSSIGDKTYDFFDVYSICKVAVIFEVSKTHPEAGAFAPCSFYMYKKKGEKVVHFAYPAIYNWFSSIDVADKSSKDVLLNAQKAMNTAINEATEE